MISVLLNPQMCSGLLRKIWIYFTVLVLDALQVIHISGVRKRNVSNSLLIYNLLLLHLTWNISATVRAKHELKWVTFMSFAYQFLHRFNRIIFYDPNVYLLLLYWLATYLAFNKKVWYACCCWHNMQNRRWTRAPPSFTPSRNWSPAVLLGIFRLCYHGDSQSFP